MLERRRETVYHDQVRKRQKDRDKRSVTQKDAFVIRTLAQQLLTALWQQQVESMQRRAQFLPGSLQSEYPFILEAIATLSQQMFSIQPQTSAESLHTVKILSQPTALCCNAVPIFVTNMTSNSLHRGVVNSIGLSFKHLSTEARWKLTVETQGSRIKKKYRHNYTIYPF